MAHEGGPWGREEAEAVPPPKPKFALRIGGLGGWLLVMAAIGGLIVALSRAFPESVRTTEDWSNVGYLALWAGALSAGAVRARRVMTVRHLRYAGIWLGVVAVMALGYAYRDELSAAPRRLQLAFGIGSPIMTGEHELIVPQDGDGGFVVIAQVNGQRVRFMLDTGATDTVLTPDDARRLGVDLDTLVYGVQSETANGLGRGADWRADSLAVGQIRFADFKMVVNQAPMSISLLGMSFLNRMESFQVKDRQLILRWRD